MKHALSALLIAACGSVLASEAEPVKAPHVEPGDCWTYRAEGFANRGPIRLYEECVTFIDKAKDLILAAATLNDGEREVETTYKSDWATVVAVDGLIVPAGMRYYKFPMRPGDQHSIDIEFRLAVQGEFAGRTRYDVKVAGWEDVVVPAGKFRALKLEALGVVRRYDLNTFGNVKTTIWYAPQAARWVKFEFASNSRAFKIELVKFRLNQ
jgi:hypothetical protein